jgi:hypothetical protein
MRSFGLTIFFILSFGHLSYAQDIELKARVWPTKARLGDEIKFSIWVEHPKGMTVTPPTLETRLAPFEIKSVETKPVVEKGGRIQETFLLTITTFELGDLKIPPVLIRYKETSGPSGQELTDPVEIKVVSSPKRVNDKDDIRPIKGPVSLDLRALWSWALGILAFLLSVFLAVKVFLGKRKAMDLESKKPAHERALLELQRLKNKGLLEERKTKEFYSELSDILRRYLDRRFGLQTLEATTSETVRILREKEFDGLLLPVVKGFLEETDLVKFAKYVPPPPLAGQLETELIRIVENTKEKI